MALLGRKTLQSERARMRRVDNFFERVGYLFILLYSVFMFISWISYRDSIHITDIRISGGESVSQVEIRNVAKAELSHMILWRIAQDNSIFYPRKELLASIYSIDSRIAAVSIDVQERNILSIGIREYIPSMLWCPLVDDSNSEQESTTKQCYLADDRGYIFAEAPEYSGNPFDIFRTDVDGNKDQGNVVGLLVLPEDEFSKVSAFRAILKDLGIGTYEVIKTDLHDYTFITEEPWKLKWSSASDASVSARNLEQVLNSLAGDVGSTTIESIDLRFGNKIFYK